jgi:hypothetical protein
MDTPSEQSLLTGDAATADTTAAGGQTADTTAPADTGTQPADKPANGEAAEAEGTKAGDKEEAPQGAPEKYEAFTMPEGYQLDQQMLEEFTPTLKELGLTQDAAQKVMDFAPKLIEKTVQQTTAATLEQLGLKDHAAWAAEVRNDKELGGEKLNENLSVARKAMDTYGSPALLDTFNKLGLGNHPEVLRMLVRVGKTLSEDSFVPGGKTTSVDPAKVMYANSKMNP